MAQSNLSDLSPAALAERQALIAGGYPLFDTAGQLTNEDRETLLAQLEALRSCCDLNISLVLQARPRNASADQDLEVLLGQLQRTNLWTPQSLVILLQTEPRQSLALRADSLSNRTQSLGAWELQALGNAAAQGQAAAAIIQALDALSADLDTENLSLGLWTLGQAAQDALYHFCSFWAVGCAWIIGFWALRRDPTLPAPNLLRVTKKRALSFRQFPLGNLESGMNILLIRQMRAPRHWGTLIFLSLLVGLLSVFVLEPAFWGLDSTWERWRLWALIDSWMARAALNLGLVLGVFALFAISPLGAWVTPGRLSMARQSVLVARCLQSHPDLSRVTLCLVWRRTSRRLEVWEPAHAALANPRMSALLDRLEADLHHGDGEIGLRRFWDQYDRLMQSRGGIQGAGKIIELSI